jgi:cardiolipin synthase
MLFRRTWIKSGGDRFEEPPQSTPILPQDGASVPGVQVFSNVWMRSRSHMRQAYLHAIRRSERSISIMNAYFIPDRGLRRAFKLAASRGVEVRVIVPSRSDVPAVGHATRSLYARLLKSGVRIFEWPGAMMHAKTGVIDGMWSTIGSYNLDKRSFLHNLEVGLIIVDTQIGETMDRRFEEACALSREIRLEEWEQRGWWQRTKELCCYQLRYWL